MAAGKKQKKSPFGTFCNVLGTAVVVLVVAALLPFLILRVTGGEAFDVTTGSMEPEIPVGSLAVVKHVDAASLTEGDVIAYEKDGAVVVHRVLEIDAAAAEITTKGDANDVQDPRPVKYDEVIGVVTHHYDSLGAVMGFVTGQKGKILLLSLIACGVLLQIVGRSMQRA